MDSYKQVNRVKLLVIVHSNDFVELFTEDQNIDVQFVHAPQVSIVDDKEEILLERLVESSLTPFWSRIYTQGKRLGFFAIRPKTVGDELNRRLALALVRELDRASSSGRDAT